MKKLSIYLVLVLIVFSACKKYDEGPLISLRSKEKRLCQKWDLQKVIYDGEDESIGDDMNYYYWDIKKDGTIDVEVSYIDWGDLETMKLSWEWIDKKEGIRITLLEDNYKNNPFLSFYKKHSNEDFTIDCEIKRLKYKEFIIEFEDDGEKGRFEFDKK